MSVERFVSHMRWWVVATVVAVVVAACGSSSSSSGTDASSAGASSSPSTKTAASSGTASGSSNPSKGTINVGLVSDFTGNLEVASNTEGALAYFDHINATGGIDGYKIAVHKYDTQSSPATAVQAFRQAVAAKPAAIVGATFVGSSGLPTLAASGIPAVGDGFTAGWTGQKTLFPLGGDLATHLSDVDFAVAKKYAHTTKVALIGSPIDAATQKVLLQDASKDGITLVMKNLSVPLVPTSAQFLSVAQQVKSSGAGAVVDLGVEGLMQLQIDLNQLGSHAKAIATDFAPATPKANGLLVSLPWAFPFTTGNPGVGQYAAAMKKFGYGKLLDTAAYAPFRWAQAALLVSALKTAGPPFSTDAVLKALSETKNFTADGVVPPASFPAFQTIGAHCQSVNQIVDGQWKSLINGPNPFVCGGPSQAVPSS